MASDCWIRQRQTKNTPSPSKLQSAYFNLSLTFLSGVPKQFPRSTTLIVRLDPSVVNLGCIHLTPLFNQSDLTESRTLNCTSTLRSCHICVNQMGGYVSSVHFPYQPITLTFLKGALQILPFGV